MFLGLGKEAISIMFAIFSVGVTLFASSPQFLVDNGDDENQLRKLKLVNNFDIHEASLYEIEKFILYNADLTMDERILKHNTDLNYLESINSYYYAINSTSYSDRDKIRLHLAVIPVYYNSGLVETAKSIFEKLVKPTFSEEYQNRDIAELIITKRTGFISSDELLQMKFRYADYTINNLPKFPGCNTVIFDDKFNLFGKIHPDNNESKCTHQELKFIDDVINDLNYNSYKFDIGNKYQKDTKIFYQDEIKTFFGDYMNWLIIGVVLVVLVGWTAITNKETIQRRLK